jgi:signal transduction histidine kinase
MVTPARRPWAAILRLLERDERVFAVLLAFVMVGGLVALGLDPFQSSRQVNTYSLVVWFAAYKAGVFALVTVQPRATRAIFIGALGVDFLLVFFLLYLTGGAYSLFYVLFFPLVAVNAFYFGPWVGLLLALVAGLLYAAAAALAKLGWAGWTPVIMLMLLMGLPAYALGLVAGRERRARGEVERLNVEVSGTLTRLQAAQQKLVEAERMATVGRLTLKVAHEVRNPIAAIGLNAELLGDIVQDHPGAQRNEAIGLIGSIREQVSALDALTEEYLAFARFPKAQFEDDSVNDMVRAVTEFVRPLAGRQGTTVSVATDATIPAMEIDRSLLRQAVLNLIKNGLEAASQGGTLSVTTRRLDDSVELSVSDTGPGIAPDIGARLFEQFFTTKPQGTGLGLSITREIVEQHGGTIRWTSTPGAGATFTITLPIKETEHA